MKLEKGSYVEEMIIEREETEGRGERGVECV